MTGYSVAIDGAVIGAAMTNLKKSAKAVRRNDPVVHNDVRWLRDAILIANQRSGPASLCISCIAVYARASKINELEKAIVTDYAILPSLLPARRKLL